MLDTFAPSPVVESNLASMSHPPPKPARPYGFQPGKSGNPGGKPKIDPNVKEAAKLHTMAALDTLVDVMKNGKKDSDRVAAANAILDRGHGKAQQHVPR